MNDRTSIDAWRNQMRLFLIAATAVALMPPFLLADGPARTAVAITGGSVHYETVRSREVLGQCWGVTWRKSAPSSLIEEQRLIETEASAIVQESTGLAARWEAEERDERLLRAASQAFNARSAQTERSIGLASAEHSEVAAWIDALRKRPEESNRYATEVGLANARADAVNSKLDALRRERSALESDAIGLAERLGVLCRSRAVLEADTVDLERRATAVTERAHAFVLAAKAAAEAGQAPQSTKSVSWERADALETEADYLRGFLEDPALAMCATVLPAIGAPVAVAVSIAEVLDAGVDEKVQRVEQQLLLIGDYGLALRQLKRSGRLRPDDPGYEALRSRLAAVGTEMPSTATEILLEGVPTVSAALRSLENLAGAYTGKIGSRRAEAILKHLTKEDREILGRAGLSAARTLIGVWGEVGADQSTRIAVRVGGDAVRAAVDGRSPPAAKEGK